MVEVKPLSEIDEKGLREQHERRIEERDWEPAGTVITPETVGEAHPMLPDGYRRSMGTIKRLGGPWKCPSGACGGPSYLCYRCSKCGRDLAES